MKKIGSVLFLSFVLIQIAACGGAESYKTPLVNTPDILQSECRPADDATGAEEGISIAVDGKDVIVTHTNILAPKGTTMGIVDTDGNLSYEGMYNYFYLEAGELFISLQEHFRFSSSDENCLYDLKIRVTHISGGIYDFMVFDHNGKLAYSKEVRIR